MQYCILTISDVTRKLSLRRGDILCIVTTGWVFVILPKKIFNVKRCFIGQCYSRSRITLVTIRSCIDNYLQALFAQRQSAKIHFAHVYMISLEFCIQQPIHNVKIHTWYVLPPPTSARWLVWCGWWRNGRRGEACRMRVFFIVCKPLWRSFVHAQNEFLYIQCATRADSK